ncbi:DNA transposase THAP9, partial [Araneus ventricosus]
MKVSEATKLNKTLICALIVDEMSIKKHIDWNKDKFIGYVDFGTGLDDDQLPVATEAYTFMLNCVNGNWKVPIGYFLINGLTAQERANIIQECFKNVHETGIEVVSLTFDGTSTNLSTAQYLGASINASNLVTSFKHPISGNDVHIILDPCHMIKLVRNTLASKGSIFDSQGRIIKWDYIESLHKFQKEEGLLAATKVRTRHIQWKREVMKVKLATQVLSASVADALLYLAKDANLPEFKGCEATVEFIQCFNNLFDVMNSRNLLAK